MKQLLCVQAEDFGTIEITKAPATPVAPVAPARPDAAAAG
jgi:hypothetical protein